MEKTVLITLSMLALINVTFAQSTTNLTSPVGVGINTAYADLHIHESTVTPIVPGFETDFDGPRDEPIEDGNYYTTLRLTNGFTSSSENDGFLIEQFNYEISMKQLENANFYLYGYNGLGLEIDKYGNIGIADTSKPQYKLNVGGHTHIKGSIFIDSRVVSNYGVFSEDMEIGGMARIGTGFECSQAGVVKAKSVRVTLDGWSDFVFDDGYYMPSLSELEHFITNNRHLPDIPSAKEVEAGGIDLGEMNAKLLQKVEELTLYVIDLQKQINEMKQQK